MTTTITHTTGTISPDQISGYQAASEARTVVHNVLNRSNPDITLREFGLRTGTLRLLFREEAAALSAYHVFRTPQVLTISHSSVPALAMAFVVADGDAKLELDRVGTWWIDLPFVEVSP